MGSSSLKAKPIYFISDLHLRADQPESFQLLQQFLQQTAPISDRIYIMGDLFDYWIGDDNVNEFNSKVIAALKEASQVCKLFFLPGNRDYLVGKKFLQQTGMSLLPDPYLLTYYKQNIVLSHGDLLCRKDYLHLIYRKVSQSKFGKNLILKRPLAKRIKIAQQARKISRGNIQAKQDPVSNQYCQKLLREYNANTIIHGHTHQAYKHELNGWHRIVLGDWHDTAVVARLDRNGVELVKI